MILSLNCSMTRMTNWNYSTTRTRNSMKGSTMNYCSTRSLKNSMTTNKAPLTYQTHIPANGTYRHVLSSRPAIRSSDCAGRCRSWNWTKTTKTTNWKMKSLKTRNWMTKNCCESWMNSKKNCFLNKTNWMMSCCWMMTSWMTSCWTTKTGNCWTKNSTGCSTMTNCWKTKNWMMNYSRMMTNSTGCSTMTSWTMKTMNWKKMMSLQNSRCETTSWTKRMNWIRQPGSCL